MNPFVLSVYDDVIAIDFDETVSEDALLAVRAQWEHAASDATPTVRLAASMDVRRPMAAAPFARGETAAELARSVADALASIASVSAAPPVEDPAASPTLLTARAAALAPLGGASDGSGAAVFFTADRHAVARGLAAGGGSPQYLGADVVALDAERGTVRGLPAPVRAEPGLRSPLAAPRALGLVPSAAEHGIAAAVHLVHVPEGSTRWEPATVPEAVALVAPAFPVVATLRRPLTALARLLQGVPVLATARYAHESDLPGLMREILESPATPRGEARSVPHRPIESGAVPRSGDVRRAAMVEAIADDDVLALVDDRYEVRAVRGLALPIWANAASWIGVDELAARVVRLIGEPDVLDGGDALSLVSAAVDALVEIEILVRV
ncbi:hypothetical protein [Microbacterium sp. No. 7]|uniref:hypothetical protein n=1 Tax=Microbacterium sp. No. 7 TaxID=1714373 RepID=UPI0006ED0261|nr:hypothetical protein [Microbacterium sp. No. 7]ALJ19101.1 hypothetical protein AOA12_03955 [Microbacterium sp. No. 7]